MKKKLLTVLLTASVSLSMCMTSFAWTYTYTTDSWRAAGDLSGLYAGTYNLPLPEDYQYYEEQFTGFETKPVYYISKDDTFYADVAASRWDMAVQPKMLKLLALPIDWQPGGPAILSYQAAAGAFEDAAWGGELSAGAILSDSCYDSDQNQNGAFEMYLTGSTDETRKALEQQASDNYDQNHVENIPLSVSVPLYQLVSNALAGTGRRPEDYVFIPFSSCTEVNDDTGVYAFADIMFRFSDSSASVAADQKTGAWASNDTGWWIAYPDGTYLTNDWYQSPESGLWYYMGPDGYMVTDSWVQSPQSGLWYYLTSDGHMLTDATTPDGLYRVDANGVWIQ